MSNLIPLLLFTGKKCTDLFINFSLSPVLWPLNLPFKSPRRGPIQIIEFPVFRIRYPLDTTAYELVAIMKHICSSLNEDFLVAKRLIYKILAIQSTYTTFYNRLEAGVPIMKLINF